MLEERFTRELCLKVNLVFNSGIGPDATNTSCNFSIPMYPKILGKIQMPLVHPNFQRNNCLEIQYQKKSALPKSRILKNKLKITYSEI